MLTDDQFRALYELLDEGQTLDAAGAPVDCGLVCGKFCCSENTTKYLLPGEQEFLLRAQADSGRSVFDFKPLLFFDSFTSELFETTRGLQCVCDRGRDLRPFNCRAFPYVPVVKDRIVVDVRRNKLAYLAACFIDTPGAQWRKHAVSAWQMVLDDQDSRYLFARLGTVWEWNQRGDRGEPVEPILLVLGALNPNDDDDNWARALRFFNRTD